LNLYQKKYVGADRKERSRLLDEFCRRSGDHRKHAIRLLLRPSEDAADKVRRRRGKSYSLAALRIAEAIGVAAGYPWSARLKGLLPLWMPWARGHLGGLTPEIERQVLAIRARQMDRRLSGKKRRLKRRLYGRTKPGTLLRRQIPVKPGPWRVPEPGYTQIDTVSHSGPCARGDFGHTLNLTDVHLGGCESRAVLGKGEEAVAAALEEIRRCLPFALRGIDSDNGSEFINYPLVACGRERGIPFTRGRPYPKNDNARIEQKNGTHVRRIFGWERRDTSEAIAAMNDLDRHELSRMMNLFQPSVKLVERRRIGAKLTRRYEPARTPLDRLVDFHAGKPLPEAVAKLIALRSSTDPFELARTLEHKLERMERAPSRFTIPPRLTPPRRAGTLPCLIPVANQMS
jgi:hypothetical protein